MKFLNYIIHVFTFFIAKAGLADFIQPSLGPLQPNLDDYMDIDPLQGNFGFGMKYV